MSHAAHHSDELLSAGSCEEKHATQPGWKLALARANAELEKTKDRCSTLQQQNAELRDELVDRLPEANERKKCLKQVRLEPFVCVPDMYRKDPDHRSCATNFGASVPQWHLWHRAV